MVCLCSPSGCNRLIAVTRITESPECIRKRVYGPGEPQSPSKPKPGMKVKAENKRKDDPNTAVGAAYVVQDMISNISSRNSDKSRLEQAALRATASRYDAQTRIEEETLRELKVRNAHELALQLSKEQRDKETHRLERIKQTIDVAKGLAGAVDGPLKDRADAMMLALLEKTEESMKDL
jgi:hypothetical protein